MEPRNCVWVIEWRRTNGATGKKWKVKAAYLDKPAAEFALRQAVAFADGKQSRSGWRIEYRLTPFVPCCGAVGAVAHT